LPMTKKIIFIIIGLVVLMVGIAFWFFQPFSSNKPFGNNPSPIGEKTILVNTLPLEERPYITLAPKSHIEPKSLGHWVTMTIDNIQKFTRVEYEFEYQTSTMIQGGMGRIDFSREATPVSKEIAFGSESKGKYKYDEGVYQGKFMLTFSDSKEAVLKADFNLQKASQGTLSSVDGKVKIKLGENDLSADDFVIVASTLGIPAKLPGKILSDPYGFYADGQRKLKNSSLTFQAVGSQNAEIFGWNGTQWIEYKTEVAGGQAQAAIDQLGTFVLVER